jgi:hypothetical protein
MKIMRQISIGDRQYRIVVTERDGRWIARAVRTDSGDRFGIECAGVSDDEAAARLTRWLLWQHQHTAALENLQAAERAYHRTVAGSAFAERVDGPATVDTQKASLDAVEAARIRLDEVRGQNPEA